VVESKWWVIDRKALLLLVLVRQWSSAGGGAVFVCVCVRVQGEVDWEAVSGTRAEAVCM
jgi:hypothetical protein